MPCTYAELIYHFKFKYQLTFLVIFSKSGKNNDILFELDLPYTFSTTHNITKSELDKTIFQWTLEKKDTRYRD